MLTITEGAQQKIKELVGKSETPVQGLRIGADAVSPLKVDFRMAFIAEGQEEANDTVLDVEDLAVYVDPDSLEYVDEATVDFVDGPTGSGFTVERPKTLPPELDGPMVEKVQQIIEQQINPALAGHGGRVVLIDIKDNVVYVQLGGGCQGCGMANVTVKQGIETAIKEALPEITEVLDVTDHAEGSNPYYQG